MDNVINKTIKQEFRHYKIENLTCINIEEENCTLYKKQKKRLEPFTYLSKKDFKEYAKYIAETDEEKNLEIVGNIFIKKKKYKEITEDYTEEDKLDDKNYGVVETELTQEYIDKKELDYPFAKYDIKYAKSTGKNNRICRS